NPESERKSSEKHLVRTHYCETNICKPAKATITTSIYTHTHTHTLTDETNMLLRFLKLDKHTAHTHTHTNNHTHTHTHTHTRSHLEDIRLICHILSHSVGLHSHSSLFHHFSLAWGGACVC